MSADNATIDTLRERGEALATALEIAARTLDALLKKLGENNVPCGEMDDILMGQACNAIASAFEAWREIVPAAPEEEKEL